MIYSLYDFADRVAAYNGQAFFELPYIYKLCDALEMAASGELPEGKKNLAINIAPRHYKTTFASQAFPAWCFGEIAADCEFILTSYTATLATDNAVAIKRILKMPWYQELYPHVSVARDEKNVQNYFRTSARGSVYAVGTGGAVTGFGAGKTRRGFGGAIIIDDPLKAQDARSEAQRRAVQQFYTGTLKSRRNDARKTPIILIAQRLHPEDLLGWCMQNEPEDWHIISFPAITDGKLLNPVTMDLKELESLKAADPGTYWAQYMQTPIIPGGNIIKTSWWRTYDPEILKKRAGYTFLTADTAFKGKDESDRSVIRVWRATREHLYCLDAIYGRWEFPELLRRAQEFWKEWHSKGAVEFWIEDKASGTPLEQTLRDNGIPAYAWKPRSFHFPDDKVGRVLTSALSIHGGGVQVPPGEVPVHQDEDQILYTTKQAAVMIEECAAFARDMSHTHDDHVDTLTMAVSIHNQGA